MITATTEAQQKSLVQYASAGGLATESLNAIRTVTALNMQPGIITQYRKFLFEAMRVGTLKGVKVGLGNGLMNLACFLTYGLAFWYGGLLVADDREHCSSNCVSGGNIYAAFFSVLFGSFGLGQIGPPLAAFASARAAVASMYEVLERKPLIDGLADVGLKPENRAIGEVVLRDVMFAYPSRPDVIVCKGYQLHVKPGETVALVGPSGCGKVSSLYAL